MKKKPVVELLIQRAEADDAAQAREMVEENRVRVNGFPVTSTESLVDPGDSLEVLSRDPGWVGRGAEKIWPLLESGWVAVEGKICLDVGASTGGFTQALLRAGANFVHAVDVGYGQLDYSLQRDKRVNRVDRYNFRHAAPEDFTPRPEFFTMDVSFISTLELISALDRILKGNAAGIVLVKPQFEARKEEVVDGVINSDSLREEVVERVVTGWREQRWRVEEVSPAPIRGREGNQEYLMLVGRED